MLFVWSVSHIHAALLQHQSSVFNTGSSPLTGSITTSNVYSDGPHNAAAANFSAVLRDGGSDGASLSYTVTNSVNSTPIPGLTISGSCSIAGGSFAQVTSCGAGSTPAGATTLVTVGQGSLVTQHVQFTLGALDSAALTSLAVLSGGAGSAEIFGGTAGATNPTASPLTFDFSFSGFTADRHTSASSDFVAALMDGAGDGIEFDYLVETLINGTAVAALTLSGTCSLGAGEPLTAEGCPGNFTLAAVTTAFASPASGTLSSEVAFTLSAGDTFGAVGGLRLFSTNSVPEPGGIALCVTGLLALFALRRRTPVATGARVA